MPPQNESNNDKDESSSSWFGSWFERDMRKDIHEQLNDFDERKKQYEEKQRERRRFFQQNGSFPFGGFDPWQQQSNDFEDFLDGRIPRWPPPELDGDRRRQHQQQHEQSMEDLHREMQSLFEQAFAGGNMNDTNSRGGSWSSSSTVVSSSNGTSYTLKQDSKTGARVDLKLPKNSTTDTLSLEVLKDQPCRIRWRDNPDENETKRNNRQRSNGQVLELGNSVDCSKLSASISEARRTLTVEAPPIGKQTNDQSLSLKSNSYPRPVRVTKKDWE